MLDSRVRRARNWLAAGLIMYAFWLLLVGSTETAELVGGLFGAAIAATGLSLVQARDNVRMAIRPSWMLILVRRLPGQVAGDCARVLGTLRLLATGTRIHGRLRRLPFDPGAPHDPLAAGRRALVVVGVSLAPNAVAVRIDGTDLIVHQLLPAPAPHDREWPL